MPRIWSVAMTIISHSLLKRISSVYTDSVTTVTAPLASDGGVIPTGRILPWACPETSEPERPRPVLNKLSRTLRPNGRARRGVESAQFIIDSLTEPRGALTAATGLRVHQSAGRRSSSSGIPRPSRQPCYASQILKRINKASRPLV
ncbi:hypothetical protein HDV57DRAFT_496012, partial [Trichoderma longibrachiatum]